MEAEFAKVNRNPSNKIAHGLVFLFFSTGCFFLWGTLMLPRMMGPALGGQFPGFTVLCVNLKWVFYALPIVAAVYVAVVCLRRTRSRVSWIGFLATASAVLLLLAFPVGVAVMLPVIQHMDGLRKIIP